MPEVVLTQTQLLIFLGVLFWTIPWKAWALWLAARRGDFWWFFPILVLNTLALLDIVYIFFIAKQSDTRDEE